MSAPPRPAPAPAAPKVSAKMPGGGGKGKGWRKGQMGELIAEGQTAHMGSTGNAPPPVIPGAHGMQMGPSGFGMAHGLGGLRMPAPPHEGAGCRAHAETSGYKHGSYNHDIKEHPAPGGYGAE